MDNENSNVEEETTVSALQVDELFLHKILARNNSSMDNSVSIPYRPSVGEVPFRWESQPGTPRHHLIPTKETVVPRVSPPPAASSWNSQEFDDVPCNNMTTSRKRRTCFWKKSKTFCQGNVKGEAKSQGNIEFDNCYMCSSSTASSRSSSSISSNATSSRLRSLAKELAKWAF
ncbi:hypothetical protein DITRI_Ditri20bG0062500 [Diplodiscus trichospermus]